MAGPYVSVFGMTSHKVQSWQAWSAKRKIVKFIWENYIGDDLQMAEISGPSS